MNMTATTLNTCASVTPTVASADVPPAFLRRLGMLVILLVTFVLGARAQNYYYVLKNANGYFIYNNNGAVGATQTFSPACVWKASGTMGNNTNTGRSLQSYVNTAQYLNGTTTSISIGANQSRWRTGGEYLRYYQNGQNRVYVNYGSSGWYFQSAASTNEGFKVLSVTIDERAGSGTTTYSKPTITLNPTSAAITYPESVTFEANASASITKTTTGQPAYTTFTFDGNTYYYEGTSGNFGEALSGVPEANTTTSYALQGYRYTLSGDVKDYLSGSSTSGSITYISQNPTTDAVTGSMVVTPIYQDEEELTGVTIPTATATITLKRQVLPAYSVTSAEDLNYMAANPSRDYVVEADFDASGFDGSVENFVGTFDGQYHVISGLRQPLFSSTYGATIKNVVLDNVDISGNDYVGGIANIAAGTTRIYNCGILSTNASTISGGTYAGGIVGQLKDDTRVVNCYSFANISGTTHAAGIVGRLLGSSSSGESIGTQTYGMSSTNGWTMSGVNSTDTGNRVFEIYAGWGSLSTRSGKMSRSVMLPAGTYKLTGKALYRQGESYNTNSAKSLGYMFAGTSRVLVPTLASANLGNNSPNSMAAAADAFYNQGLYTCELTFTLDASQSIELGYDCTHDAAYSWFIAGEMTLEQMSRPGSAMVMNCMYYGKLSGTNNYPIYGGTEISNVRGINTYNYYRLNAGYTNNYDYGCAQPISDDSYLTRFEFYRHILNSHRELAAIHCFNDVSKYEEIDKWVLDTKIAPYPIIKKWITNTQKTLARTVPNTAADYAGKQVGSVDVTVIINGSSRSVRLPITDMDTARWDYTYGKVVLPYANEFTGWSAQTVANNNRDRIITGWEITSMTGGTQGNLTNYNFADPDSKVKDLYSYDNGYYVYAQGGNLVIPKDVTAVTVTAHWADAVYLRDGYYDLSYDTNYANPQSFGGSISGQYNGKTVYTDLSDAINQLPGGKDKKPADQAIVLVGNYHYNQNVVGTEFNGDKPYTIMSVDRDKDQEPDYCWYSYHTTDRTTIGPHRFDFIANVGLGMAARVKGSTPVPTIGIWHSRGWSEYTETYLGIMTECEINSSYFDGYYGGGQYGQCPWIANGGVYHQVVHCRGGAGNQLSYIRVGGKAYIKQLHPGNHDDNSYTTTLAPINVCGGEIEECYLTGRQPSATTTGNAYFWCNGGYIHEFLGAYMEPVNGNVTAKIDHGLIDDFYGGGANANKPVTGNINITINNSYVKFFCGGPKVGDMSSGTTVVVNASGTTFGEYYGGGYGGTALTRVRAAQNSGVQFNNDQEFPLGFENYTNVRLKKNGSVNEFGSGYGFEYFLYSGGSGTGVARFYVDYASLSLATVQKVTSTLDKCTILQDFYGGGCQGRVAGDVTSVLTSCQVNGNVFGGGYTATATPCLVYPTTKPDYSKYIKATGSFTSFGAVRPDTCYWVQVGNLTEPYANVGKKEIYTTVDMTVMGEVKGKTTLRVDGTSQVLGGVYGGGNMSRVNGSTDVTIETDSVYFINEVYGGANRADVGDNTTVNILSGKIGRVFGANNQSGTKNKDILVNMAGGTSNYVYGAGNLAAYKGNPQVVMSGGVVKEAVYGGGYGASAIVIGTPQVKMSGGVVGYTETVNKTEVVRGGDVFGGGNAATVQGNTSVVITGGEVKHNVYGGGNQADVSGTTNVKIGN